MDDKELAIEQDDDHFDDEELDFTLDGDEEETPEPEAKKEEVAESKEDLTASELAKVRADYESLKAEKTKLEEEREQASIREEEANRITVQTAITQRQGDVTREKAARRNLLVDFEEAKANGDIEKIKSLTRAIGDKDDLIEAAQNDISQWQPLLNNRSTPKSESKPAAKAEQWQVLAEQWAKENSWVEDPKFKDKKDKAVELYNKLRADGYDHNKISFWTHINGKLEEFDKPKEEVKRRTPPAVRTVIKQGGSPTMSDNKKKADREILTAVHRSLERRGVGKNDPQFDKLQKSYYATFKREIDKSRESNG